MKHYLTAILLVLAITSCTPPAEKPVSEQPQATEGTPEPARVQTPVQEEEPSPKQMQPAKTFLYVNNPPVWQQAFYVPLLLFGVHTGHSTLRSSA